MRFSIGILGPLVGAILTPTLAAALSSKTAGIEALVQRRLPNHADKFIFSLSEEETSSPHGGIPPNDEYTVASGDNGTIHISGSSPIALATGLRWYMSNALHLDMYWFVGSRLHLAPAKLPRLRSPHHESSVVPLRYHLNTVTFSYTAAFWQWEDWQDELDWMALHGINLPLAWIGYEKLFLETFVDAGFKSADVLDFMTGPAFQAWNRFGNLQRSWGGSTLAMSWVDDQFELGKQIIARMVDLGMTPVLPCFTGFVPSQIADVYPDASFARGNAWAAFPEHFTNDTFLEPSDPLFAKLQKNFITKQKAAFGDVSHIYTLDQYNEIPPINGTLEYLSSASSSTIESIKAADPDAIWMLQGWLFFVQSYFWTKERVEAYLGAVDNSDMLILDLWSESYPQWQNLESYFGKPWIFCQVHDFGGDQGLYGQVQNVTVNPIEALAASGSMVGVGLTMEGQEGNEVIYDILLDQAWSETPIDASAYFQDWAAARYGDGSCAVLPGDIYKCWEILGKTVYNNTDKALQAAVSVPILTQRPTTPNLLGRVGLFGTHVPHPDAVYRAWSHFYHAGVKRPSLWENPVYRFDMTDFTRQVFSNAFTALYSDFDAATNVSDTAAARKAGQDMLALLSDFDDMLVSSSIPSFFLPTWIADARAWAPDSDTADFYEYNARNQITLWGPNGEIKDYANKQWGGLVRSYYLPRWERFVTYTLDGAPEGGEETLEESLHNFEFSWQREIWGERPGESFTLAPEGQLQPTIAKIIHDWPRFFSGDGM